MGKLVEIAVRDGVALITVDHPPVNALTQSVRAALAGAVDAALGAEEVSALVIRAAGRGFPSGARLPGGIDSAAPPSLAGLCDQIEASPKPVLAAIHGAALGGGLELALACHFRLAAADARLGLPDVALGLVPSAGASQRLPRLVGARAALEMLVGGKPVGAEQAARIGLIDKAVPGNLDKAAFGSARNLGRAPGAPPRSRDSKKGLSEPTAYLDEVAAWRARLAGDRRLAPHRAVDLVEAALLLPFDAGLAQEQVTFEDLEGSDQARGLRHVYFAERRLGRRQDHDETQARTISRVGIVGAGRLGIGLARACLAAGLPVAMADRDGAARAAALVRIEAGLERAVAAGRLEDAARRKQRDNFVLTDELSGLVGCDCVIEAVADTHAAKKAVFEALGTVTRYGTLLVTTGGLGDVDMLAAAAQRRGDVLGLHFVTPVETARVTELISPLIQSRAARADLVATAHGLSRRLGKLMVEPGRSGSSIAVPLSTACWRAAALIVEAGADPRDVDAAMRAYGFARGPFQALDLIGLDRATGLGRQDELFRRMKAQGWVGRKAGRGFYPHGDGAGSEDLAPGVEALLATLRRDLGLTPRAIPTEEVQARCVGAMINAGAALVESGVAAQPSDVDLVAVLGYGFPRWRGGPMEAADLEGLLAVRNRLRSWAGEHGGGLWAPAPLFDALIKNGQGFDSRNR